MINKFKVKNITNKKRISRIYFWLFGGTIIYKPAILMNDGKLLAGEENYGIWQRLYFKCIYPIPFIKKYRLKKARKFNLFKKTIK